MTGWIEYGAAWACFLGAHMIPALPGPRGWLIATLGRRGYLAAFSLLSIGLLYWLIVAAGRAPYVHLWDQPGWSRWLVNIAMPVAILIGTLSVGMSGLVVAFALWAGAIEAAEGKTCAMREARISSSPKAAAISFTYSRYGYVHRMCPPSRR